MSEQRHILTVITHGDAYRAREAFRNFIATHGGLKPHVDDLRVVAEFLEAAVRDERGAVEALEALSRAVESYTRLDDDPRLLDAADAARAWLTTNRGQ